MSAADTEIQKLKADLEKERLKNSLLREEIERDRLEELRPSLLDNMWVGLALGFFGSALALGALAYLMRVIGA